MTFAGHRTTHAAANLRGIEVEFGEGAAKGIPVHAELFRGLALIALVVGKHFEDVALLELLDGVGVRDSRAVHLDNDSVKFALQGHLTCTSYRV